MVSGHYPFQSHFFDRAGLKLHYWDEGDGAPVVMLHGNPTWSFLFRDLVKPLADRYRCIVPDHIGCGLSDKPDDSSYGYRLRDRTDDLANLLEHLGITESVNLVLHDWGGMVGMTYAVENPARIASIVLMNTAAFLLPKGKRLPWQIAICRNPVLGPLLVRGLNLFCRGAARHCVVKPLNSQSLAGYLAPYDSWANRRAVLRFIQDIPLRPSHPSYDLITRVDAGLSRLSNVPILLCWGEKDFVFDEPFLAAWTERFPDAELCRIENAGHYLMEDEPELVSHSVTQFLDKRHLEA